MSISELEKKIEELQSWAELAEQAKKETERLKAEITAEMAERDTEEMTAGKYIVRYTLILSNRFDSTAFKREHDDLYKQLTKQVSSRRFSIG